MKTTTPGYSLTALLPSGRQVEIRATSEAEAEQARGLLEVAPHLISALRAIVAVLDGRQPKDLPGALMVAQSAIARVEGGRF